MWITEHFVQSFAVSLESIQNYALTMQWTKKVNRFVFKVYKNVLLLNLQRFVIFCIFASRKILKIYPHHPQDNNNNIYILNNRKFLLG